MRMLRVSPLHLAIFVLVIFLLLCVMNQKEAMINFTPGAFRDIGKLRAGEKDAIPVRGANLKPWEKAFCLQKMNTCYGKDGPRPKVDCPNKEEFLDWSMYNPAILNGYQKGAYPPIGVNYAFPTLAYKNSLDRIYNPLRYPYRSEAFFEQGWNPLNSRPIGINKYPLESHPNVQRNLPYPNMNLPPQVIGCGGRRQGCLGGSQIGIPNIPPPIEISERNIAPVNITTRGPLGVPQQVGVLYKIFGSLNDVYPLYGRKRWPNSDTWDYYTAIGKTGNQVKVKVLTKRKNHNELGTNDVVMIQGNSGKFRVSMYERDFPVYIPYA